MPYFLKIAVLSPIFLTKRLSTTALTTYSVFCFSSTVVTGIKIVGGTGEDLLDSDFGIFVKRVIPGGLASESGEKFCSSLFVHQGRIQDFHLGGAQKIICANAHYEREIRNPFRQGSRARLRALEALGVFNAL